MDFCVHPCCPGSSAFIDELRLTSLTAEDNIARAIYLLAGRIWPVLQCFGLWRTAHCSIIEHLSEFQLIINGFGPSVGLVDDLKIKLIAPSLDCYGSGDPLRMLAGLWHPQAGQTGSPLFQQSRQRLGGSLWSWLKFAWMACTGLPCGYLVTIWRLLRSIRYQTGTLWIQHLMRSRQHSQSRKTLHQTHHLHALGSIRAEVLPR